MMFIAARVVGATTHALTMHWVTQETDRRPRAQQHDVVVVCVTNVSGSGHAPFLIRHQGHTRMKSTPTIPLQINFRNLETSEALAARVREKVDHLGHVYPTILSAHVTIEQLHRHHTQGKHFRVRIDLKTPGHTLIADREPDQNHAYTDVYVALRDAVAAMRRQLEDLLRRQQDHVKHHEEKPHGHITEISPDKTFGRIESVDGRWLYFHRNSLIGEDLDKLQVGTPVYYVEDVGDEGPQASSVYPVGKHHILV